MSNRAAILRCCLVGALLLASAVPARGISVRSSSWHMPVVGNLLVSEGFVRAAAARDAAPSAMARGPSSNNNNFPSVATGVAPQERRQLTGSVMTDSNIYTAVAAWLSDSAAAEVTYGHISTWQTSGVTDMSYLFCADTESSNGAGKCHAGAASFNEDMDLVVGDSGGDLNYIENTGTSTAPAFVQRTGSANPFDDIDFGSGWNTLVAFIERAIRVIKDVRSIGFSGARVRAEGVSTECNTPGDQAPRSRSRRTRGRDSGPRRAGQLQKHDFTQALPQQEGTPAFRPTPSSRRGGRVDGVTPSRMRRRRARVPGSPPILKRNVVHQVVRPVRHFQLQPVQVGREHQLTPQPRIVPRLMS